MYLLRQKTFCAVVKHKKYMNPLRTSGPGTSRGSLPQENLVRFSPLVTQSVDIPLRTLDSAAGRQAFNFPTKAAPAKGSFGTVWLACLLGIRRSSRL